MDLHKIRAEHKLLNFLEKAKGETFGMRCLKLKLSQMEESPDPVVLHARFKNILTPAYQSFLLLNGDMIVLDRNISIKMIAGIEEIFMKLSGEEKDSPFFEMIDAHANYNKLLFFAQSLIDNHEKEKALLEEKKIMELKKSCITAVSNMHSHELAHSIAARRKSRDQLNIMVVEDDLFSRNLVSKVLRQYGNTFPVEHAKNAVAHYLQHAPNVVFLDIDLPYVNGHDILTSFLKADPEAYIVMLSSNGDRSNILKAVENGAKGFIGKPFRREKLEQYIYRCPTLPEGYSHKRKM